MNKKTWNSEKPMMITDFISALENEIEGTSVTNEKIEDIKKYLNQDNRDYHSLQAIMDILVSIPVTDENMEIIKLRDKILF